MIGTTVTKFLYRVSFPDIDSFESEMPLPLEVQRHVRIETRSLLCHNKNDYFWVFQLLFVWVRGY